MDEQQNAPIHDANEPTTAAADEQPPVEPADDDVTQQYPEPHDVMPGYGVTGKFPQDDPDADADSSDQLVSSAPASETDELVAPAGDGMEVPPASQADQLDAPAPATGDTA